MGNKLEIKLGDKVGDTVAIFFFSRLFPRRAVSGPQQKCGGSDANYFYIGQSLCMQAHGEPIGQVQALGRKSWGREPGPWWASPRCRWGEGVPRPKLLGARHPQRANFWRRTFEQRGKKSRPACYVCLGGSLSVDTAEWETKWEANAVHNKVGRWQTVFSAEHSIAQWPWKMPDVSMDLGETW